MCIANYTTNTVSFESATTTNEKYVSWGLLPPLCFHLFSTWTAFFPYGMRQPSGATRLLVRVFDDGSIGTSTAAEDEDSNSKQDEPALLLARLGRKDKIPLVLTFIPIDDTDEDRFATESEVQSEVENDFDDDREQESEGTTGSTASKQPNEQAEMNDKVLSVLTFAQNDTDEDRFTEVQSEVQ